jgi:alpha-L-arabinofuranosidase
MIEKRSGRESKMKKVKAMPATNTAGLTRRNLMRAGAAFAAGPVLIGLTRKAAAEQAPELTARVTVEPVELHALPKTQYGHFIEHLGRCIKGGVWAEGEEPDMFLGGVRKSLLAAMRSIHPPLIRWPGGCFADGYHWRDGIGARASRPRRRNKAWGKFGPLVGPTEDNHFGTDEFCRLCAELGAEPMLTANVGSGKAEEAAAWVEYVNGGLNTPGGRERAANGHPGPYGVKYWCVGNEIFSISEIGRQTPDQYVQTLRAYGPAMRSMDPSIKLIAVGGDLPDQPALAINKVVLQGAAEHIDYLSLHQYAPPLDWSHALRYQIGGLQHRDSESVYYDILGTLNQMTRFIEHNSQSLRTYLPAGRKIQFTFDEWNLWFNFVADIVETNYNLRDGLWAASVLNLLHRRAPEVPIANIAQMVNCLGIITSNPRGTSLTPTALAFQLYSECAGEVLLKSTVDGPQLPHESQLPALDLSATRAGDRIALLLINRHYRQEMDLACFLPGFKAEPRATRRELYHRNAAQYNTPEAPGAVSLTVREELLKVSSEGGASSFSVRLPPHSLTCLEFKAARV